MQHTNKSLSLNKLKLGALAEKAIANPASVKGGVADGCHVVIQPPTNNTGCDNLSGSHGFTN